MDAEIAELDRKVPQLNIRAYMEELANDFTERRFMPLGDLWDRELGDIFGDMEE
jgi:hypothetical protein